MDARKQSGQTPEDLDFLFEQLPLAGLCFDIAHAKHVDDSLDVGRAILDRLPIAFAMSTSVPSTQTVTTFG